LNTKIKAGISAGLTVLFLLSLLITNFGNLLSPVGGIWNSSNQAYYPKYMEIQDSSLDGSILAYRDNMGIPHMFVESEADFAFAIGYLQAQDRLFSFDIQRRFVKGQVAELMGPDFLDSDKEYRLIGFERLGREMWAALQVSTDPEAPKIVHLMERFCDGINRYIRDISPNNLPMEYLYLGITPEAWTPLDICALAKYMSYMLSFLPYDLTTTILADAFGKAFIDVVMPIEPFPFETPVIPDFSAPEDTGQPLTKGPSKSGSDEYLTLAATLANQTLGKMNHLKSWIEQYGGCSNNWVVNGSLTTTGYPILCGDPHLPLMLPSIWWEFNYVNIHTGESLYGVAFPGTPICEIGMNNFIGWSATITANDVNDFYIEKLSPDGSSYLFNKTQWRKIEQVTEVIKVKGAPDCLMTVNFTRHNYTGDNFQCPIYTSYKNHAVSVKWTGFDPDPGIILAFYKMAHSMNVTQFQNALKLYTCPGQNFVFGSIQGDIGMFPTARYPVRNATGSIKDSDGFFKGIFLLNGSNGEDEWTGYIPFEWIPQKINPDQMYLASANQRTVNTTEYKKYYLSFTYDDGYRARSINRYLSAAKPHSITIDDMQRLQADTFDVAASVFIPYLLEAVKARYGGTISDPWLKQTIDVLTSWNRSGTYMDRAEVAPTIWYKYIDLFINATFYDDYAKKNLTGAMFPLVPSLENLMCYHPDSKWFNDTYTSQTENSTDIMLLALNRTIKALRTSLGDDITEWKWGRVHQMDIQYLMGVIPQFNIPKYPTDGDDWTINVAAGYNVHAGPSMRMIIDFSHLAKNDTYVGFLSYPGGQSGNPLSPHYRDSFELWKNCQYHSILFPLTSEVYPTDYIEATVVFKP